MIRPAATYRIQFRGDMTLHRAAELAPYLAKLGVSHVYASPITTAAPGSTHGYDVANFNEIDPAIGGREGFETFAAALQASGLGLILDFVPNHMGATPFNPWWRDVLEWGSESDYREHFDIDWSAPKLVVPILGQPYGEALQNDLLSLEIDERDGGISLKYYDVRLPLTPPSYARILARIEAEPFAELARRFAISKPETAPAAKEELARLAGDASVRPQIDAAISGTAADRTVLHDLHEAQAWRLSYWRAAREGLTYRRFFEIADLVGVRVERPRVFDDVHALVKELWAKGQVQGLRIDHIDGLADPKTYLTRLQEALGGEAYILVEKILGPDENVRSSWPVAGTTGYEFILALAGLFADPRGATPLADAYAAFLGHSADYPTMVRETKRRILTRNLAGELEFLKDLARQIADRDPFTRDYGADSLRRAILEFAAALPVYRTYVNVEGPDDTDRAVIATATEAVRAMREVEDEGAIAFVAKMLLLDFPDPEAQGAALVFAARFQQTTGPVMAKALEDTVFYRYNRLIALNEVGGEPENFGAPVAAFHAAMQARLEEQPLGLSTTATHDTKRGEDARARLYAISEMPEEWGAAVVDWSARLTGGRTEIDGTVAPEAEIEWMFYQALAGAWPADLDPADAAGVAALGERIQAYMRKAVREAKLLTSWSSPAVAYEEAVDGFLKVALSDHGFLADFAARTEPLRLAGAVTSLAQLAISIAAPGVPDIYNGTEFWDLSLVDPDNRRPIDFDALDEALAAGADDGSESLVRDWRSGRMKLRLMQGGLQFRRDHPELFGEGEYVPLQPVGAAAEHVIAFARRQGRDWLIAIASRLSLKRLAGVDRPLIPAERWGDTYVTLPPEAGAIRLRDVVFDRAFPPRAELPISTTLAEFPVALLHGTA